MRHVLGQWVRSGRRVCMGVVLSTAVVTHNPHSEEPFNQNMLAFQKCSLARRHEAEQLILKLKQLADTFPLQQLELDRVKKELELYISSRRYTATKLVHLPVNIDPLTLSTMATTGINMIKGGVQYHGPNWYYEWENTEYVYVVLAFSPCTMDKDAPPALKFPYRVVMNA